MEWNEWKPWYERITSDLGYDPEKDRESARLLRASVADMPDSVPHLERMIRGRHAVVFGPAQISGAHPEGALKISAGSATARLLDLGIWPDIIVTDLDGDVAAQASANKNGALAVIHAHGDNMDAIREWARKFSPPVVLTTQAEPIEGVHNFGGFTDGDRAVFIALHFGASQVLLEGFDFLRPMGKPAIDAELKRKKLEYARQLIEFAGKLHGTEMVHASSLTIF